MKRHSILLFVMSIISFIIAALGALSAIAAIMLINRLSEIESGDDLTRIFGIFAGLGAFALFIIGFGVMVVTSLPGILGVICAVKNGKFSTCCLIIGGIASLRSLAALAECIIQGESIGVGIVVFLYFGLYTAGAALVYIHKKRKQQ